MVKERPKKEKLDNKEGKSKNKTKIIKNFFYGVEKVYRIDKGYIIHKVIHMFLQAIQNFLYAYILKVAIQALEENVSFQDMILRVLIIISMITPVAIYTRIISNTSYLRSDRIDALMLLEVTVRSLDMDYELLERPETQDAQEKAYRNLHSWGGVFGTVNHGFSFLNGLLTFFIACGIIISMNWMLIIAICALAIFKMLIENRNRTREKTEFYDQTPAVWRRISYANSIAANLDIGKDLRIYKMNEFINIEHKKATDDMLRLNWKNKVRNFKADLAISSLAFIDSSILYGFLIYEVIYKGMQISMFTFMISAVYSMVNALNDLIRERGYVLENSLQADDYKKFMTFDYVVDETNYYEIDQIESVEFRGVYYSYYMQEGYALENVSFKLKKGEKLALVGYNGAGKTTIVKLLTGLYKVTKGNIYINGIDINEIKRSSLAKVMSPVYQEASLFALSLAENIAMAQDASINYDAVHKIIKTIDLEEKTNSLPDKEKTMITKDFDEKGVSLSGGENQKVSLARAMYKDASLYILDEPTSSMDALSEFNMYNNFNQIVRGNMTIYISHRLSSTKFCDRIVFLSQGKVIEDGTHEDLMSFDSEYKKLFTMQADYYIKGDDNEEAK